MKLTTLAVCLLCLSSLFAQKIDLSIAHGGNKFYDWVSKAEQTYAMHDYEIGTASAVKLGIEEIVNWKIKPRFELGFEMYNGSYHYVPDGHSSSSWRGTLDVMSISVACYPINLTFFQNFNWNLGFQSSLYNFSSNSRVNYYGFVENNGVFSSGDKVFYDDISSKVRIGVVSRLAYDVHIKNGWSIQPQVNYSFGFTRELRKGLVPSFIKSMRIYGGIGISKEISVKK